jgi:integrase
MARNRYPTVSKGTDGQWHAYVTVGTKGNGRPDQRHVKRATRAEVEDRVDELLDQCRAGAVVKPGRGTTVEQWLTTYLDTVAPRRCDPSTVYDYRSKLRNWVFPVIGGTRVDRLKPDQLDDVYLRMARAGKADSSILKTHRILSRALEIAYRRGLVPRNVAKLIDAPTSKRVEITPLTEEEALAVLDAAAEGRRRNVARWSVGLALGLRQGEALGLRWPYVDLDAGEIRVWWQLHRRSFEHGCGGSCGKRRGGNCPARVLPLRSGEQVVHGGLILKEPKGKSKRTIPIPAELVAALVAHKEVQGLERQFAGGAYARHGFVFAHADGRPLDPGDDFDDWKGLLAAAGVRDARVHDGRHTAATLLLAQGVRAEVVQELLGHSDIRVTRGYSHVASAMARAATDGMGAALLRGKGRAS